MPAKQTVRDHIDASTIADQLGEINARKIKNAINIVLCPLLIYGPGPFPELGVAGSAVATTTGRGIGVAAQVFLLLRGRENLRIGWRHVRVQLEVMGRVLKLSGTATLQVFIGTASWVGLVRVLSTFGSEVLASSAPGISSTPTVWCLTMHSTERGTPGRRRC